MTADLDGLWPTFRRRVDAMLADPAARQLGLYVVSGFRPLTLQRQLFEAAVRRYGTESAARKWVAPPGHSNHGPKVDADGHEPGPYGRAVDLAIPGYPAVAGKWPPILKAGVDALAARFGLRSPMAWEDWHYEPDPATFARSGLPPEQPAPPGGTPEMLTARNQATGGHWACNPVDGSVYSFDAEGNPDNEWHGALNTHPEYNTHPDGSGAGAVFTFAAWRDSYVIVTRDRQGGFHSYHFPSDNSAR